MKLQDAKSNKEGFSNICAVFLGGSPEIHHKNPGNNIPSHPFPSVTYLL
jgi:hypothetical protein